MKSTKLRDKLSVNLREAPAASLPAVRPAKNDASASAMRNAYAAAKGRRDEVGGVCTPPDIARTSAMRDAYSAAKARAEVAAVRTPPLITGAAFSAVENRQ
jgi:hypothetical protein